MHSSTRSPGTGAPAAESIPLAGLIADGDRVSLGWPEPAEFDLITALRNRPAVRGCFLDPRPLDLSANRAWLAHGMQRPREGLLSIRLGYERMFCGTIGWSGYDAALRTFEIGRLMVDAVAVRRHRAEFPDGYRGVAVDASTTLLRFAFETIGLDQVTSVLLSGVVLARRVNILAGGVPNGEYDRARPDGSHARVASFVLTRERWLALQAVRGDADRIADAA